MQNKFSDVFYIPEVRIDRVIFCNLDAVTGRLWMPLLKDQYGEITIIHQLRKDNPNLADEDLLALSNFAVIATCWDEKRTITAVQRYTRNIGLPYGTIRLYSLNSPNLISLRNFDFIEASETMDRMRYETKINELLIDGKIKDRSEYADYMIKFITGSDHEPLTTDFIEGGNHFLLGTDDSL